MLTSSSWLAWTRWINPVAYGFESAIVNEFHGREFFCASYVPSGVSYENVSATQRVCAVKGSGPGTDLVNGMDYVTTSFQYSWGDRWINVGIILAITFFLLILHLVTSELVASERSKGEVLVFRRSKMQKANITKASDEETGNETAHRSEKFVNGGDTSNTSTTGVDEIVSIFHWEDVTYEIPLKDGPRRILDSVDGWIKPGTLTALMGVSGAGKTTLLDVLASRTTIGVITGNMLVDGHERDESFQRKTGYAMQQDIHLSTSTVREALEFSALLRQPPEYDQKQRLAYVDHVIKILDMEAYSDAIIGIPGSGLNVERKSYGCRSISDSLIYFSNISCRA